MSQQLLAPPFLFQFAAPCREAKHLSSTNFSLDASYRIPCFAELQGKNPFAEVRVGWSAAGIALFAAIEGKMQSIWCRDNRIEHSDGMQIWFDTRNTKNVHRAGRFCHRFVVLPAGSGRNFESPTIGLLAINRARESPREIHERSLQAKSRRTKTGYEIEAFFPAEAITGFDPAEHPRIGFTYSIYDREVGLQTFTVGAEFPFSEDPSLWGTLEFTK